MVIDFSYTAHEKSSIDPSLFATTENYSYFLIKDSASHVDKIRRESLFNFIWCRPVSDRANIRYLGVNLLLYLPTICHEI